MEIIVSVLVILLGILLVERYQFHRQLKELNQQLRWIKENDTNKLLTQEVKNKDFATLVFEINETIQKQRKSKRQIRQKDKQFRQSITNVSHDIRTPLTSLKGYLQLLQESNDEKERQRYLSILETRLERLQELLDELFLSLRLEEEDVNIELVSIEANELLLSSLFHYIDQFEQKEIKPDIQLNEAGLVVQSNQELLSRVFDNIIRNAVIHGEKWFRVYQEGSQLIFENPLKAGTELHPELVFERFYKQDTMRSQESSGIGLSIVAAIMEKLNGKVEAEVEGEIFRLMLTFPTEQKNGAH